MIEAIAYLVSSFWLGALHAATPGHGKTIAAAYIVGARGRPTDALALGIFVTLSHTAGIVLVAVLASLGAAWAMPARVEAYLAVATGLKLAQPHKKYLIVVGDGDAASIGTSHLIHAARRNLGVTVICEDNMGYESTGGQFSPTTRYRDYAISPELIHWESQSVTRADSETGLRYREHAQRGSSVMLFARERADERAFWFLGPATYVRHEGERPMAITWRLRHALPGDLYAAFAAAVA